MCIFSVLNIDYGYIGVMLYFVRQLSTLQEISKSSNFCLIFLPTDLTTDPMDPPPVFFHASAGSSAVDVQKAGYGSLSDTPSIISVPPCLSPLPSAMPFPPLFLSRQSLRTISAKDLEKSCI